MNNFLLSQFGYEDPGEILGKKIEILIPSRFHNHHVDDRNGFIKNPKQRPMGVGRDLFGIKKTGQEFPVEISLSSYKNEEELFVIVFVSDITKRKQIEQAVFDQQKELAEINKTIDKLNQELENKVIFRTEQLENAMQLLQISKDELTKALSKENSEHR